MATPRRSKYIDAACVAALRDHAILEAAIVAYEFAVRTYDNRAFGYRERDYKPDESLRRNLWQKRAEAATRAMMFGNLSTNDDLRKQGLAAATEFIYRENSMIVQYLNIGAVPPTRYLSDVNTQFRDEIMAALQEKFGVDAREDLDKFYGSMEEHDILDTPPEEYKEDPE